MNIHEVRNLRVGEVIQSPTTGAQYEVIGAAVDYGIHEDLELRTITRPKVVAPHYSDEFLMSARHIADCGFFKVKIGASRIVIPQ